jgi:hypothetical protein
MLDNKQESREQFPKLFQDGRVVACVFSQLVFSRL